MLQLYRNHPIDLLCKTMGWFLCNSNTALKWQAGCMVKANRKIYIYAGKSASQTIATELHK